MAGNPIEVSLSSAEKLAASGKYEDARKILVEICNVHPIDPMAIYKCAMVHDNLGLEQEAIPLYEKAIELGLSDKEMSTAILGLGSSYRCLGKLEKSVEILEAGVKRFPENAGIRTFLAMTYHEKGYHGLAMKLLLECLVQTSQDPTIEYCRQAISNYAREYGEKDVQYRPSV